jgi:hypothetical protein
MSITTFTIDGVEVNPLLPSFEVRETVGGVSPLTCDVTSFGSPVERYGAHDVVVVQEDGTTIFAGIVMQSHEKGFGGEPNLYDPVTGAPEIVTTITAEDYTRFAERIHVTEDVAEGTLLKTFLTTLVNGYLGPAFSVTLHASQVNGPALPAFTFDLTSAAYVLEALSDATGYTWRIDYDKQLRMWLPGDLAAPFNIDETDDPASWTGDVEVETFLGDHYANRVIVVTAPVTEVRRIESFVGDGVTSTFTLAYTLTHSYGIIHRYVTATGEVSGGETFGIPPDAPLQWEYDPDTNTITRTIGPTESGFTYRLTFDGTFEASATAEDAGEIAAHGLYEHVERRDDLADQAAADALAASILAERLNAGEQIVTYQTRMSAPTLRAGQQQTIIAPSRNLSGNYIITELRVRAETPATAEFSAAGLGLIRTVIAKREQVIVGKWQHTYRDWLGDKVGGAEVEAGAGTPASAGPAPPDKSVQFNRNGVFGGDGDFIYYEDRNSVVCGGGGSSITASEYESVQAHGYNDHIADGAGSPSAGMNVQLFPCQSIINATTNPARPWHVLAGRSTSSSQTMDMPVAVAGTYRNLAMLLDAAPGTGTSRTFTIYKNTSATALAVTISDSSTTGVNTSDEVAFAVGDLISLRNAVTGLPAAANWKSSLEFEPDDGTTLLYGYAQVFDNDNGTSTYAPPFWGSGNADATTVEADEVCEIGAACTVTHWEHRRNAAPGTGVTCTLHLMKNGVAQDGTGGTVDTTLTISGAAAVSDSATFSLALAVGDTLSIRNVVSGGTSAGTFSAGTFAVTPDTVGEVQYHASHLNAINSGYVSPVTASGGLTTSFSTVASIAGPTTLTLGGLWVRLNAAPDTGNGWRISLVVDGVDTAITVAIEDASTTGSITGQSVSIPSGSLWGLHVEEIGSPAEGSQEMWIVLLGSHTTGPVLGSVVWGTNTTVAATLAIAMGLDGLTHTHDTPHTFIVYGDEIITGNLTIEGNTTITGTISVDLDELSDVALASPVTDGDVLTYDSGTGTWTNAPPSGGAGSPGSVAALDDLTDVALGSPLTDGEVLTYDSGTGLWTNAAPTGGGGLGFLPDFTAPVNGDYAWVNQETATVTVTDAGIVLAGPASAGEDVRGRVKTAPSTPYVITAAFLTDALQLQFQGVGLCWRDSSGGGIVGASFGFNDAASHGGFSGTAFRVYKWNSPTSFSNVYASSAVSPCYPGPVLWLRIADNSTNRTCAFSTDGVTFTTFHTVGRTDFITADQVGFFINAANATWGISMTLLSWEET